MEQQNEIVLYQPDELTKLEVRVENETVWLSQQQIVELFASSKANISEHIKNIYAQHELEQEATVRNFRTVRREGNRQITVYHIGASIKDLGKKLFAFSKMEITKEQILSYERK